MKQLSREEFNARFSRRPCGHIIDGIVTEPLIIVRDTEIRGIVTSSVAIEDAAHVFVSGIVSGPVTVGPHAVLWCEPGLVEGRLDIRGAALLSATVGHARGTRSACVHDPCEPPDASVA